MAPASVVCVAVGCPPTIARRLAAAVAVFCSVCCAGCAQVTVFSDKGPPHEEWKFGVLAIELAPSANNTVVTATGLGLISSPSGTTLGYSDARLVRIGDDCRVVISTRDLEAMRSNEELRRFLKSAYKACVA